MSDKFFNTQNCDRCGASLAGRSRQMSWFTEECLCEECIRKEQELKEKLVEKGEDVRALEGCGYIPKE